MPAADLSSKNDFDTNSIDSISIQSDRNDLIEKYLPNSTVAMSSSSGHIKRYKMERKNSQQSQHGKLESMASGSGGGAGGGGAESIKWECDPSVQELIGDTEIRVKIAGENFCINNLQIISFAFSLLCAFRFCFRSWQCLLQ